MISPSNSISQLILENPDRGYALFNCGILFSEAEQESLALACRSRGLNPELVATKIAEERAALELKPAHFRDKSLLYLVRFLQGIHTHFVERRLPYLAALVSDAAGQAPQGSLLEELAWLFPVFHEDFIHHIHEEEDRLFGYLVKLEEVACHGANAGILELVPRPKGSLSGLAVHHLEEEDDLKSLRDWTDGFQCSKEADLIEKVILHELRLFDTDLKVHSLIENEVLFPKAMLLENRVRTRLEVKSREN